MKLTKSYFSALLFTCLLVCSLEVRGQQAVPAAGLPAGSPQPTVQQDPSPISNSGLLPVYGLDFQFDPSWVDVVQFPSQSPSFPASGVSSSFQQVWDQAKSAGFNALRLPLDVGDTKASANQAANLCVWARNNNVKLVFILTAGANGKPLSNDFPSLASAFVTKLLSNMRSNSGNFFDSYPQIMAFQMDDELNFPARHGGLPAASAQQIALSAARQLRTAERAALGGSSQDATPIVVSASFDFEIVKVGAAGSGTLSDAQYSQASKALTQFITGFTSSDVDLIIVDWFPGTIGGGTVGKLADLPRSLTAELAGKSLILSTGYSTAFHSSEDQKQFYSLAFANLADYRTSSGTDSPFLGVFYHAALNTKDASVAPPHAVSPDDVAKWDWNAKGHELAQVWTAGKRSEDISWWLKKTQANMGIFSAPGDASGTIASSASSLPTPQGLTQISTSVADVSAANPSFTSPAVSGSNSYGSTHSSSAASSGAQASGTITDAPTQAQPRQTGLTGLLDSVLQRLASPSGPGGAQSGRDNLWRNASNFSDCGVANSHPRSNNSAYDSSGQPTAYPANSNAPTNSSVSYGPAGQSLSSSNPNSVTYGSDGQPIYNSGTSASGVTGTNSAYSPGDQQGNPYRVDNSAYANAASSSSFASGPFDPGYGSCNQGSGALGENLSSLGSGEGLGGNSSYGSNSQPIVRNGGHSSSSAAVVPSNMSGSQPGISANPNVTLASQDVTLQPASPQVGQTVTITAKVKNQDPSSSAELSIQAIGANNEWLTQPASLHVPANSTAAASLSWAPSSPAPSFPLLVKVTDSMGNDVTSAALGSVSVAPAPATNNGSTGANSPASATNLNGGDSGSSSSGGSPESGAGGSGGASNLRIFLPLGSVSIHKIGFDSGSTFPYAAQPTALVVPVQNRLSVPLHNVVALLYVNNAAVSTQTMSLILPQQSRSMVFPSVVFPHPGQQNVKIVFQSQRPNAKPQTGYVVQLIVVGNPGATSAANHGGVRSIAAGGAATRAASTGATGVNRPPSIRGVRSVVALPNSQLPSQNLGTTTATASQFTSSNLANSSKGTNPSSLNPTSAAAGHSAGGAAVTPGQPLLSVRANEIGFNSTQPRPNQSVILTFSANVRNSTAVPARDAELIFQLVEGRSGRVLTSSPVQRFAVAPNGVFHASWKIEARPTGEQINVVVQIGPQQMTSQPGNRALISVRLPNAIVPNSKKLERR